MKKICVLILSLTLATVLQANEAERNKTTVTVESRSHNSLPTKLLLRLDGTGMDELTQDIQDLAQTLLKERGAEISPTGSYTLYLVAHREKAASRKNSTMSISTQGSNKRLDSMQLNVQLGQKKASKQRLIAKKKQLFSAHLEGPAGVTYWNVAITVKDTGKGQRVSESRLVELSLAQFGQSDTRQIELISSSVP